MLRSSVTERLDIVSGLLYILNYYYFLLYIFLYIFSFVFYLSIIPLFLCCLFNWFYGFFGSTLIITPELNYCFPCSNGS